MSIPTSGALRVSGRTYLWQVECATDRYPRLARFARADAPLDVLRIHGSGVDYDVAILVHTHVYPPEFRMAPYVSLGPLLVLGDAFPDPERRVSAGRTLDLRPRNRRASHVVPGFLEVQRIVQWSLSRRFRPWTAGGGCPCEQCVARTATIEQALAREAFVAPPFHPSSP